MLVDQVLQLAVARLLAEQAVVVTVGQQQLEDGLPYLNHCLAVGIDHHAVRGRSGTRRRQSTHVLDLYNAQTASAVIRHLGVVT